MNRNRQILLHIALLLFSILFILCGSLLVSPSFNNGNIQLVRAKVVSVDNISFDFVRYSENEIVNETIYFTAEIRSGDQRGETVKAQQYVDHLYPHNPAAVKAGDNVTLQFTAVGVNESAWVFNQFNRIPTLLLLIGLFFFFIILLARKKSIPILLSLVISVAAIFAVYIPAIMSEVNIYLITVIIAVFIIATSLLFVGGFNKKSYAAIAGNVGGVLLAGLLAILFLHLLNVTGMINEDYVFLLFLFEDKPLDLRAVVWSGILIGSLGAVMDVAMTISSAINELSENMVRPTFKKLLTSGMNIGHDAIGTMVNTLILAYIGGSLAMVLLLVAYQGSALYLLNLEMIVVEIAQAISGSIGILFAVPATALVAALWFRREGEEEDHAKSEDPPSDDHTDEHVSSTEPPIFRIGHDTDSDDTLRV